MTIFGIAYDLTVGVVGAVLGAFVMLLFTRNKTRRMSAEIVVNHADLEKLRLENNRLIETIKNRETEILDMQKKILKKKTGK